MRLFLIGILGLSFLSVSILKQQNAVMAQQSTSGTSNASKLYSITSGGLPILLLNQIKPMILKNLGNKSKGGVSIVVGVITPNGTSVSGYGNISKANTTKVNGNTIFNIGSITKTFTTALLADMVNRGLVKLDDPLQKYLPSYVKVPTYHNDGHNITLEDLATHTSGLPDLPEKLFDNRTYPTQQIFNYISHASLVSEPGVRFSYNNLGMGLLGYVLSLKAGVPYGELVKDRILNVLGMDSTGIAMNNTQITTPLPDILKSRLAKGHMGGREVSLAFLPEVIQPSGALYSSANDLLKYLAANMGLIHTKINDILQDTHLIRHEVLTVANSSSATKSLQAVYTGLGWNINTNFGTEAITKDGAIDGYISVLGFNPTKQIGLVILCSCDERNVPTSVFSRVLSLIS
jgi:serine-type D-Ala-D-Ala carboxypeptidase/endopeptidase